MDATDACVPQFGDSARDMELRTPVLKTSRESELQNHSFDLFDNFYVTDSFRHRSRIVMLKGATFPLT